MTVANYPGLPAAWSLVLERHAPTAAREFLADARRYLVDGGSERVPRGREAETLKNLVFAYIDPEHRDAVVYELALASLLDSAPRTASPAGLIALGSVTAVAIALARRR